MKDNKRKWNILIKSGHLKFDVGLKRGLKEELERFDSWWLFGDVDDVVEESGEGKGRRLGASDSELEPEDKIGVVDWVV